MLIKNAHIISDTEYTADIQITDDKITAIGQQLAARGDETVIDATGATVVPGLIDVHVHFREPGFTAKETIKTGAQAAAHGGFTTVVAMSNLKPVPDTVATLTPVLAKNRNDAKITVRQFAPITHDLHSDQLVDMPALLEAGALGFSNDGVGVQDADTMYQAMKQATKLKAPIVAHIEDASLMHGGVINAGPVAEKLNLPGIINQTESSQLARDLDLAEATGVHYHACHVSTRQSVALIREAKKRGVHVTAEVSPHHLLLDENNIPGDNPMFKMNPPLRSRADHLALLEGLQDGTLDMIATDHAPHTAAEKSGSFKTAAFGIVGSETAFPLLYTKLVKSKMFTLKQLIAKMSRVPAEKFGLPGGHITVGGPADLTILDLDTTYTIDPADWFSKGKNSPFIGEKVQGQALYTISRGRIAYQKGGQA
ncbi:dihydroorotase [Lacticaseibacillus parahuelsenbergensis]|uniref:Dihydroorotase n=1 Tax=Lacticaseibacillus parahuelsenbergensis TaxID=3068305 RepID=A0ABY9L6J5_9LACO|nr:dihydroorotase [Lacticaseibacillus sp. NCIMB 15471]WLV79301.1 dihydroorotase [Lacticaseibacillus sp. NCIMB 15471]